MIVIHDPDVFPNIRDLAAVAARSRIVSVYDPFHSLEVEPVASRDTLSVLKQRRIHPWVRAARHPLFSIRIRS
jgi:hypothetical protein